MYNEHRQRADKHCRNGPGHADAKAALCRLFLTLLANSSTMPPSGHTPEFFNKSCRRALRHPGESAPSTPDPRLMDRGQTFAHRAAPP